MDYLLIAVVIGVVYAVSTLAVIYLSVHAPTIESDEEPPYIRDLKDQHEADSDEREQKMTQAGSDKGSE